jgi:prepilin-type N-terminal cleavage/methylation domain-containing protein
MKIIKQKGVTIIELLIVVAIIGSLVSIVWPQFSKFRETYTHKNMLEDVLSILDKARSKSLASLNSSEYGVHFEQNKVIIFKGKVFSEISPDNEITNILEPVTITNIFPGGSFYFNRLNGMPSNATAISVTLSVQGNPGLTRIITISKTGAISVN